MRAPGGAHRPRAQGADQQPVGFRPQELFLSRPAAGLSDQPVQIADRRRGRGPRRYAGRAYVARRDRAAASRAGCRQIAARPARYDVFGRSQSFRRGADGDRDQTGSALRRGGKGLSRQAAHHPALPRHLRRRHGEGSLARRRERIGAPPRRRAGHALRDQEPQFDPLHRPGDRARGVATDRNRGGRRRCRAGDAAVRSGQGRNPVDA